MLVRQVASQLPDGQRRNTAGNNKRQQTHVDTADGVQDIPTSTSSKDTIKVATMVSKGVGIHKAMSPGRPHVCTPSEAVFPGIVTQV